MHSEPYVHSLGALTGMQAMQMVKGGLKAIYCSGWQVAADANAAAQVRQVSLLCLPNTWRKVTLTSHEKVIQHCVTYLPRSC